MVACHVCPFSHFDPPYGCTPLLPEGVTRFPSEPLPPNSNSLGLCYETLALTCLCLWTVKLEKVEKELRLGTYYMPGRVLDILNAIPFSFHNNPKKKALLLSLLYTRKLRPKEVKELIQGHTVSRKTKIEAWIYVTPNPAHIPLIHVSAG